MNFKNNTKLLLHAVCFFCAMFIATTAFAQIKVSGYVLSPNGAPVAGANVAVKGTNNTVQTDADGRFSITAASGKILIISCVGYADKVVMVGTGEIKETLQLSTNTLNDVVVIGYQTVRKKDLTGAVSVVDINALQKNAATTVGESLQGLVAGVNVRTTGRAGGEATVEIRGVGSLLNNTPFYVIDGLPATNANRDFNANDIESIQVLKDASAAAIYGARAANGVVIITTKKGKEGPMKVNFSTRYGVQKIPKTFNLMNAAEFAATNKLAYQNGGVTPMPSVSTEYNPNINTNWQDETLNAGGVQDYDLNFSGGGKNNSYFISGNYFKSKGTVIDNIYDRISLRVNAEGRKGIFKIGENFSIISSKDNQVVGNPLNEMVRMLPVIPVYDVNNPGGYGYGSNKAITYGTNSIAQNNLVDNRLGNIRIRGNAYAELQPLSWLKYRFNVGLETSFDHYKSFRKDGSWTFNQAVEQPALYESRAQSLNIITEHTLNFNYVYRKHKIDAVGGFNYQTDKFELIGATKTGFTRLSNGTYLSVLDQGNTVTQASGYINKWSAYSYFGRVNYSFDDRYLLSGTLRRDADSRFGKDNRVAIFPAVSAAWRISKEKFFNVKWISDLKIRGSYGELGNITLGPWQYLGLINPNPRYVFGDNQPISGATQTDLSNADLKWENKQLTNIGIDFSLFNSVIYGSFEYYKSVTKDVLTYDVPFPWYQGGSGNPPVNAASLQNTGFEASITYAKKRGAFKYDVTLNVTTIKNKVLELGKLGAGRTYVQTGLTRTEVGRSLGEFYGYKTDGIFQTAAEVAASGQPYAQPGDIRFVNNTKDNDLNADDRQYLGSPWPKLETGLVLNAAWKSFDASLQLYGLFGRKIYNSTYSVIDRIIDNSNYRKGINPWTLANTNTDFPRLVYGSSRSVSENSRGDSDRWLEDGSYFRVRNVQVGFNLSGALLSKIGFQKARFYAGAQNLLTITKYRGLDPDITGTSLFERGVDGAAYPTPRTFMFGIQCGF
jgi:TonB-dependent starch-binding outer membrane protein SusC